MAIQYIRGLSVISLLLASLTRESGMLVLIVDNLIRSKTF